MVLPTMAALRAGESDSLVCFAYQLYSNNGQLELPRSDNSLRVSGFRVDSSQEGRLCFTYRPLFARKPLRLQALDLLW